ncbi:MAG: class I SAM-dependent methyltransferase [Desulfococcaceae bacterium]|jgi:ubiquinone/menaquinone biosynthesis C-methylase UbiE|nr:class I SAM-dependent methyltransferase [Desulfococcaceae bacterium]
MTSQADFFDSRAENWETNCYPPAVRDRLESLIPEFGVCSGEHVLDIGTGPGTLLPYLQRTVGNSGHICAFDISANMVKEARKKIRIPAAAVLRADVHHIPCRKDSFDRVICFAAFPHFENPAPALREMTRVAKPGAKIIIAHLMSREELAKHHGGHCAVADDILPDHSRMEKLFLEAGLSSPVITDIPGRYLAGGVKIENRR